MAKGATRPQLKPRDEMSFKAGMAVAFSVQAVADMKIEAQLIGVEDGELVQRVRRVVSVHNMSQRKRQGSFDRWITYVDKLRVEYDLLTPVSAMVVCVDSRRPWHLYD